MVMAELDPRLEEPSDVDGIEPLGEDDADVVITEYDVTETEEPDDLIRPPDTFKVLTTSIRFAGDGTAVADLIAEIEDVPGATGYEVRITKVA